MSQIRTERGIISVTETNISKEEAIAKGYSYSFTAYHCELQDRIIKADVYGKCLDNRGLSHEFVLVRK